MAIKDSKIRVSISLDKTMKEFLDHQSTVDVRNISNIVTKLILDTYGEEYKKFLEESAE